MTTTFEYDSSNETYFKYHSGSPHNDGVTGNQLEFKNVIILATSISTRSDGKLMDIGLESGNGYYVSMGKAQPITWSKDSDDSPIKLYDESGNEISINAGKSYIGFISENNISIE